MINLFTVVGCKKSLFNRPTENAITLDNFYRTADQVNASTNGLYNSPWFEWVHKNSIYIPELMGGNGITYSTEAANFGNFSTNNTSPLLLAAWRSFFTVVAQANAVILNMPEKAKAAGVDEQVINNALGEAHFMRGLAYFYLVRFWGNVPIIENSAEYISNFQINTNPVKDVYTFIVNDLQFAEANCRKGSAKINGHVSANSASAMLAKVYLYMQDYQNAWVSAEKVINSGEFGLYGIDVAGMTYNDLFKTANNNNIESVAALQWVGGSSYGHGNAVQGTFAYSTALTGTGDGYNGIGPSVDLQKKYGPGDKRIHGTIMLAGDYYPELLQTAGGYTVPSNVNSNGSCAALKKYIVGTPSDNGGKSGLYSSGVNTYLMRFAEVYLIAAEAILGNNSSTTDVNALKYFNLVRQRAGLNLATSITKENIFQERRMELAFESDYWFDLTRMDGWDGIQNNHHPNAISIISNQERGTFAADRVTVYTKKYIPKDADFQLPIPVTESGSNPKLLEPPVPYHF